MLDALEDTLQRNSIPVASLSAVATVGGGAAIPLVTQRLSEQLRAPVVTLPAARAGAPRPGPRCWPNWDRPPTPRPGWRQASDVPTGLATAAWAAGAAGCRGHRSRPADGSPSATFRALAWSQDDEPAGEPVPYSGEDYTFDPNQGATAARPPVEFEHHTDEDAAADPAPLPWYKRPPLLFGAAAAAALLAVGGLAVTLTSSSTSTSGPVTDDDHAAQRRGHLHRLRIADQRDHHHTGPNGEVTDVSRAAAGDHHDDRADDDHHVADDDHHVADHHDDNDDHHHHDDDHHHHDHTADDDHHHHAPPAPPRRSRRPRPSAPPTTTADQPPTTTVHGRAGHPGGLVTQTRGDGAGPPARSSDRGATHRPVPPLT